LVIAGISDFARPAEKLSLTQNAALMGTGAIWTRWCMIIKPRNVLYVSSDKQPCDESMLNPISFDRLATVNFFLGCVGAVQVTRIFLWQRAQSHSTLEAAKEIEHEAVDSVKAVVDETEGVVKKVVKKST
jgi:hypothetical protein